MFTGIVSAVGTLRVVDRRGDRLSLTIGDAYDDLAAGESIAVDGACLTVVEAGPGWFRVDAIVTTRGRTRFDDLQVGDRVNLERAMSLSDRLSGHLVQGHVDGVGVVRAVRRAGDAVLVDVAVPEDVAELLVPHGSIAINGVSLTVNAIPDGDTVQVALIPFTLEHTTLGSLEEGTRVHLEADLIGKYVRRLVRAHVPMRE
jgi:riboflavin synthase